MLDIMIVEDDRAINELIYMDLKKEGYICHCAYDGAQAADMLERNRYDLVLLDIMLPKINGYELLSYIRPMNIPVIFITAKGTLEDKIKGLRMGADDYIVKPFQSAELLARVEAILRRTNGLVTLYEVYDVTINTESRTVKQNGVPIEMTMKEFDLLVTLIKNRNIAMYREQLYEEVWKEQYMGETRTLDTHIQRLRKKLGWEKYIKTVFRIGYRLEVR